MKALRYYKNDGIQRVEAQDACPIDEQKALREVKRLPIGDGNFIGFVNDRKEVIQFIRRSLNLWLIDVPVTISGHYVKSLQCENLPTDKVKEIVVRFFADGDWQSLCTLRESR